MLLLQLVFHWLHIFGAVLLVGGAFYHRFAFQAALGKIPQEQRDDVVKAVRSRWAVLVMMASGLLLISGMTNFCLIAGWYDFPDDRFPSSIYHPLFGVKFLAALGVFFISSRLAGGSDGADRFRQRENLWSTINLLLAVLVVCLAGLMGMADRTEKGGPSAQSLRSHHNQTQSIDVAIATADGRYGIKPSQIS